MTDFLTQVQADAINRDCRQFGQQFTGGLAQLINDLENDVDAGPTGINSYAWDIDSICLGGGAFSINGSTTVGLTLGLYAGRIQYGQTVLSLAASTTAMAASTTNYVEVDPLALSGAGEVVSNTVGFTAGHVPLYTVVTGASAITSSAVAKVLLYAPPSAAALTRSVEIVLGNVTGNVSQLISALPAAAVVSGVAIGNTTTVATSNTNYWSFGLVDTGAAGTGSTNLLGAGNTTQLTGGSGLTANVMRSLSLNGTPANLDTAAGDGLLLTITGTGSPANLTGTIVRIDFAIPG